MSKESRFRLILDVISTVAITSAAIAVGWMALAHRSAAPTTERGGTIPRWKPVTGLETAWNPSSINTLPAGALVFLDFSDFQCPFCARYATDVFPQLWDNFVEPGEIHYMFRNFPLESIHERAFKMAEAAECAAAQAKFWPMHKLLFSNPRQATDEDLTRHAETLKLDIPMFAACLDGQMAARITDDETDAKRLGVRSTPTFMLGRVTRDGVIELTQTLRGVAPYTVFRDAINSALAGSLHR